MKRMYKYTIVLMLVLGAINACNNSDNDDWDGTKPSITINSPTNGSSVKLGDNLLVSVGLVDNVGLDDYVISINASSGVKELKGIQEFTFNSLTGTDVSGEELPEIDGKTSLLEFEIKIDENARVGFYNFTINVKDDSGNTNEKKVQFNIVRP